MNCQFWDSVDKNLYDYLFYPDIQFFSIIILSVNHVLRQLIHTDHYFRKILDNKIFSFSI